MGADPVAELLAQSGFGKGVIGRAPHRYKELSLDRTAALGINQI